MFKILSAAFLAILFSASASAAVKFQVRSTSDDAYYATGVPFHSHLNVSAGGDGASEVDACTGCFGGHSINLGTTATATRSLVWQGGVNWIDTQGFSIHIRRKPLWTGFPTTAQAMLTVSDATKSWYGGVAVDQYTDGTFHIIIRRDDGALPFAANTTAALSSTAGTVEDIYLVWDGLAGASKIKVYTNTTGNAATLFEAETAPYDNLVHDPYLCASINMGSSQFATGVDYKLIEMEIWDAAIDPVALGVLSDFIPTTAASFWGYNQTDPGVSKVLAPGSGGPSNYIFQGLTKVGTYSPALPAAADLRLGTVVSSVTGTLAVPNPIDVIAGIATDHTVGTYNVCAASDVRIGVAFGISGGSVGTYDGSDRWTDPGVGNVKLSTAYKANSVTNNRTGTLQSTDPGVANVLLSTPYVIESAAKVGTYTSSSTDPGLSNVKLGINYILNGSPYTGTYDGSDRWSDPGQTNVSTGTAYKANSTVNNKLGSRDVLQNLIAEMKVGSDVVTGGQIVIAQGDGVTLQLKATASDASAFDLTGAVFQSTFKGTKGLVVVVDGFHVANPDQSAHRGSYTITLSKALTAQFKPGDKLEFITRVTQGSTVGHFRGVVTVKGRFPN